MLWDVFRAHVVGRVRDPCCGTCSGSMAGHLGSSLFGWRHGEQPCVAWYPSAASALTGKTYTIADDPIELSVDEAAAREAKWCIDTVTGMVRRCTNPKEDAKKAKQDEAGVVVPDAICNRRQKKKEKTFEYEVKWQFKSMDHNTHGEGSHIKGCFSI